MKQKLDALELVQDEDYQLQDVLELRPQGGYSTKKVYIHEVAGHFVNVDTRIFQKVLPEPFLNIKCLEKLPIPDILVTTIWVCSRIKQPVYICHGRVFA
jgi:hypothetical protein